jgi:hypothetical protein
MSKSTWTGAVNSDWADADNWSPAGVPDASSDVTIATGAAVASASIEMVNSITDSSDLSFESAGTNTVTTTLDNTGHLHIDHNAGAGGTKLNIGGTLTNGGSLSIGNATLSASDAVTAAALDSTGSIYLHGSGADQALLNVTADAGFGTAGVLSGDARLVGDSAIEFKSGEITSLAADAQLHLNGSDALIEDSSAAGSNSALTGLASIGAGAIFGLHNKAAVWTTGSLDNDGHIHLDFVAGDGGSNLTVGGTLTNSGSLTIGNTALSASDEVTASALDNIGGNLRLFGSGANQALLEVTAGSAGFGTAGVLRGFVRLVGDSAIEFKSGEITSLAAHTQLRLNGNDAFIEDSTALGSNSALAGLASIGYDATFALRNGAAVSTTGSLDNKGYIFLDLARGDGGSSLTLAGALTNSGFLYVGNTGLSAPDEVTAAVLDNTGLINLGGSSADPVLLDVTGSAGFGTAGVLTGSVALSGDSAIEFTSGQITTIAANSSLTLGGNNDFIEDSTAQGSNSALTGLASIGAGATFDLENEAAVSTTGALANDGNLNILERSTSLTVEGALTNSGLVNIGMAGAGTSTGAGTLSIAGALTNTGKLNIFGNYGSVTAKSFVNSGTVNLTANGTASGALNVSGTLTNNGSISIVGDTEELTGAVDGAGGFSLSTEQGEATANLVFDSSVSAGQIISETGADALTLEQAQSFAGTISGFGSGDTIDAANFLLSGTTHNFAENSGGTGGTLTLQDGSLTANIRMTGDYSNSNFTLAPDSGTGTLVKFV